MKLYEKQNFLRTLHIQLKEKPMTKARNTRSIKNMNVMIKGNPNILQQ